MPKTLRFKNEKHPSDSIELDLEAGNLVMNYLDQQSLPVKFIITVECNKKVPGLRIHTGVGQTKD